MTQTRETFVPQDSASQGRGPATRGFRKHAVAVAMMLLIGVQGSALATSDGTVSAPVQVSATGDTSAAGPAAVAASTLERDAGLIGVLATEIVCGAMLLVGIKRHSAERRQLHS